MAPSPEQTTTHRGSCGLALDPFPAPPNLLLLCLGPAPWAPASVLKEAELPVQDLKGKQSASVIFMWHFKG